MNEHGRRSEKRVAKSMGMKLTPASGALPGAKGDFRDGTYLVEAKSTVKDSISIKHAWLQKISQEAMNTNRVPLLHISFVVGSGQAKSEGDWIAVPAWWWKAHKEAQD